jgi:hypothetical protein
VVAQELEEALSALGAVLADRGYSYDLFAVGGGALALMGVIDRATKDLDVVALVSGTRVVSARPLPAPLREAAAAVAGQLGLARDWIDDRFAEQLRLGLPPGFLERAAIRDFDSLRLRLAGRRDQIFFKLYADVDGAPGNKHHLDLLALSPAVEELRAAAEWVRQQEVSPHPIEDLLRDRLAAFGVDYDGNE